MYYISLKALKQQFSKMANVGSTEAPESSSQLLQLQKFWKILALVIQNQFIFKIKTRNILRVSRNI